MTDRELMLRNRYLAMKCHRLTCTVRLHQERAEIRESERMEAKVLETLRQEFGNDVAEEAGETCNGTGDARRVTGLAPSTPDSSDTIAATRFRLADESGPASTG